jgi:hypothetical protein
VVVVGVADLALREGLAKSVGGLEDLALDVPKAPALLGGLLGAALGAGLGPDAPAEPALSLSDLTALVEPIESAEPRRALVAAALSAAAAALDDLRISVAGTIAELVASANFSLSFTHSAETSVTYSEWAARKMYFEGDSLYKDGSGGSLYCVSLSGYSGRDEPIWPDTAGQTVSDGDVVWRFHPWVPYANPYQILAETCSTGFVHDFAHLPIFLPIENDKNIQGLA